MPQMFPTQWIALALFFPGMVLVLTVKMNYFFSQPTPATHSLITNPTHTWTW
uniref:ATP synthase F0 subunit 8 n=1 Tax=Spirobolus bungii TaxID=2798518 RepID=A0A7T6UYY6_9MYRI|nr:ATP synthase F0 subunit 8 [Spirobolus bungii]QQJ94262.1 ATP synthase F0 subunit 8 [Spirobolus bungii]